MYSIIKDKWTPHEQYTLINEYERQKNNLPCPKVLFFDGDVENSVWQEIKKLQDTPLSLHNNPANQVSIKLTIKKIDDNTKIWPVIMWEEEASAVEVLRKILKKYLPNTEYEAKKWKEGKPSASLQTGEIFEYFASGSKHSISTDAIRTNLIEKGLQEGISQEMTEEQVKFVENFLYTIFH